MTNTVAIDIQKIARVVPRKRNIEIWLLFFAYGINAFELAQIQLSTIEILTFDILTYWAPLAVAATVLLLRRLGLSPVLVNGLPVVGRRVAGAGRAALARPACKAKRPRWRHAGMERLYPEQRICPAQQPVAPALLGHAARCAAFQHPGQQPG